jgi:hypothetical protein
MDGATYPIMIANGNAFKLDVLQVAVLELCDSSG